MSRAYPRQDEAGSQHLQELVRHCRIPGRDADQQVAQEASGQGRACSARTARFRLGARFGDVAHAVAPQANLDELDESVAALCPPVRGERVGDHLFAAARVKHRTSTPAQFVYNKNRLCFTLESG